jgi:hypothetical protein
MKSRKASNLWAAWAFALALLLKAAMPMLASGSAHLQGKALVEVCTVYGVATLDPDAGDAGHEPATGHASDHCALSGLTALAGVTLPTSILPAQHAPAGRQPLADAAPTADRCAAWMARLKHAPPHFA